MTARLIELADQRGWKVNAPRAAERRGGTVAIDMPNAYEVGQELLRRDVLVDFRPRAGVRFSPHFYNTVEEIDRHPHRRRDRSRCAFGLLLSRAPRNAR